MSRPHNDRIVRAEAWLCPLEMPWSLRLGAITYRTRDYVVLQITSESGHRGTAIGYTRGTPLLEALEILVRELPGLPLQPDAVHAALRKRFAPGWRAMARAASLIDVALWEITALAAEQPLHRLLGTVDAHPPLMAVAGYFSGDRSDDAMIEESIRFADEGYSFIKIILPGVDPRADEALVDRVRNAIPGNVEVAVDFHGAFDSVETAVAHCEGLDAYSPKFIEDPFPSSDWRRVKEFAQRVPIPVAAGEDLTGLNGFLDLLDAGVQLLRVDVTASGGYTSILEVISAAESRGARVVPHVWPHFHAPLASASSAVALTEVIPEYVGADPVWKLLAGSAPISAGQWRLVDTPGLNLAIDFDAVQFYSTRTWATELASGAMDN